MAALLNDVKSAAAGASGALPLAHPPVHVPGSGSPASVPARASRIRRSYLRILGIAFALFSSIRILTYLPTLWAIHTSGDSDQYSLWTWATWVGANATMAAWLYETNGRRLDAVGSVTVMNAVMCLATSLTIVYYRL